VVNVRQRGYNRPAVHDPTVFERYLISLSDRLTALPAGGIDGALEAALREVGESLGTDRTTLLEGMPGGGDLVATHTWARPGFPGAQTGGPLAGELPWYVAAILRGETVALTHLPDDLPADAAAERAFAREADLKSSLTVPVSIGGRFTCALATHAFRHHCVWSERLIERFRLVAQILGHAVARREAEREAAGRGVSRAQLLRPLAHVERGHILAVLEARGWKINGRANTADILGLHPNTLRSRMKKLGIRRPVHRRRRAR